MAKQFLTSIDLSGNQIINSTFEQLASDPNSGNFEGRIYFNTTVKTLRVYANSTWNPIGDITNVQGTTNEITVSVDANGVATVGLPDTIYAELNGNASTATKWATGRKITLGGDLTGEVTIDGSQDVTLTATVAANNIELGTDTTGDYVATIGGTDGVSVTGAGTEGRAVTIANTDKGSSQNIFKTVAVAGQSDIVADTNNDTLTVASGTGISLTTNATTDTLTIGNSGVTSIAGTADQISLSGSTGSVTVSLPSAVTFPGTVTLNADPSADLQAATKQYVDAKVNGLTWKTAANVLATANVPLTGSTPLSVDSHTLSDGYRVVLTGQTTGTQNGIYTLAISGGSYTLSRAADGDAYAELVGASIFIQEGTAYGKTSWVQANHYLTSFADQNWYQISGQGTYSAGNGLTLTGGSFSIDTSITVDKNTAQTLTNKTLTSPTISGLYLSDNNIVIEGTADTNETTLVFTDPTADRTITFKDASGTVAFESDIPSTTDGLAEGSTNKYFTDERAQDAVGGMLTDTDTIDLTYTDADATITAAVKLKSSNSYLSVTNGLNVDITALESKLVTDSFTRKAVANVGNGSATSYAVSHSLATRDVQVQVFSNSTYDTVEVDVVRTDSSTVTISFATAPSTNAYRVVIVG
jgi:hypothetical protein